MSQGGTGKPRFPARENRRQGVCGLCGQRGRLTKTHTPPQCAGNRGHVRRFMVLSDAQNRARASTKMIGGIHFYGLCGRCNSSVQGRWDASYCVLAKELWPLAADKRIHLPAGRIKLPSVEIQPGAVARSVLASCFALNPNLRNIYPTLATDLIRNAATVTLEPPMDLFLALTRGPFARATGAIGGFYLLRPKIRNKNIGVMSMAQIYFPPLAWQLADAPESRLLELEGWSTVSSWLRFDPNDRAVLNELVPDLPLVVHPTRAPGGMDDWTELLSEEAAFVVEGENALRSAWD